MLAITDGVVGRVGFIPEPVENSFTSVLSAPHTSSILSPSFCASPTNATVANCVEGIFTFFLGSNDTTVLLLG